MTSGQIEPSVSATAAPAAKPSLEWQVHLVKQNARPLPLLALAIVAAALLVWATFRNPLPAIAAVLLLLSATSEYLFPVRYRVSAAGIFANSATAKLVMKWDEVRRCLRGPNCLYLSPLPAPSRLDAFRGISLRLAPTGEPGDLASALAQIGEFAPRLLEDPIIESSRRSAAAENGA